MKKTIVYLLMFMCSMTSWAQGAPQKGQPRFDPQKFQQMVEESLTKTAGLTPEEARAFFPPYNEMRAKQREMGKQINDLKKNVKDDPKAYAETIKKINQLKVDMAEIEQSFYQRILKVVPADKVFKIIKAEDDFYRHMVQRQRGDRPRGSRDARTPHQHRPN